MLNYNISLESKPWVKSVKYKCKIFKQAMYKVLKLQKLEICTLIYLVFIFKVWKEEENVEETV